MKLLEVTEVQHRQIDDNVIEHLENRGAIFLGQDGVYHLAKEHSFSYHDVLLLMRYR